MAAQVNPLGSLASGMAQTAQALAATPSSKSNQAKPVESNPGVEDQQAVSASEDNLGEAAKTVEAYLQQSSRDLQFGVDKATGQYYFKVVDPKTQKTIRQVPAEEILAMAKRLRELDGTKNASGVLMDKQG